MKPEAAAQDWQTLAQTLADGFESLLKEVEQLSQRERDLQSKLKFASQEYSKLALGPIWSLPHPTEREAVARKLLEDETQNNNFSEDTLPLHLPQYLNGIEDVRNGFQAYKSIRIKHPDMPVATAQCPVSGTDDKTVCLEQDFTTQGKQGDLGCPFARRLLQSNGVPTPPQDIDGLDPIAAEFHPEVKSLVSGDAAPPSASGGAGKCPIRYLDQHSPEEVAKYFENHKHEIPRSHEICVKRYQKNSESIRELDSKYGNLVSMIQGLGVKHQQYLPGKHSEQSVERDGQSSTTDAVSRWAEEVSRPSEGLGVNPRDDVTSPSPHPVDDEHDEERSSRFQRPLREIRVGESPSRPWGISVPVAPDAPPSPEPAPLEPILRKHNESVSPRPPPTPGHQPNEQPQQRPQQQTPRKCPFDHTKMTNAAAFFNPAHKPQVNAPMPDNPQQQQYPQPHHQQQSQTPRVDPNVRVPLQMPSSMPQAQQIRSPPAANQKPIMVFNGPVFFGYDADQAAEMMKAFYIARGGGGGGSSSGANGGAAGPAR